MFPIKSLNDQERHDYILKTYVLHRQAESSKRYKRDIDVIKEHHRFLWDDDTDATQPESWEEKLARKYYDKLFKEYCIADLTHHKENKIALRWRTEAEVVSGNGQFSCGSRKCEQREELRSWEVNFAYQEQGERKNALVKLRLCPKHSSQLNHTSRKREVKRLKRTERQQAKDAKRQRQSKQSEINEKSSNADEISSSCDETITEPAIDMPSSSNLTNMNMIDESNINQPEENVWSNKIHVETETTSRENEFERYLEDLLL